MSKIANKKKVVLSARSVCKDFRRPNGNLFTVLEGINIDIYDGELLAIVGLSGSGKSTLLRCLAGLLKPDRGKVNYARPTKENLQLGSFVFQNFALFPWMTVRENIEVSLPDMSRSERTERVDHAIQLVGLRGYEDAYPRELSGGMKQRVGFARAMVADPMILFMDEPFSALDPLTSESLKAEILRIWTSSENKTRAGVLVTHRFDEALQLADRVIILSSNPGTIFHSLEIPMKRPRVLSSREYLDLETHLENIFGKLHLDRVTEEMELDAASATDVKSRALALEHVDTMDDTSDVTTGDGTSGENSETSAGPHKTRSGKAKRIKPLIKTSLTFVEGLITRLSAETEPMDLYDLCEDVGQSVDQVLPAIAAGEILGFLVTPGIKIILTDAGRAFAAEGEADDRQDMMRQAILKLPIVASIYELVKATGDRGLEAETVQEQIVMLLPFEDHDIQFQTLLRWSRHANLMVYDSNEEKLFPAEEN